MTPPRSLRRAPALRAALALAITVIGTVALPGCFDEHAFRCAGLDNRCDVGERCVADHCAVRDKSCADAPYRYTRSAGPSLAGTCVAAAALPDGGLACAMAGDPCDDGDPCTEKDTCIADDKGALSCSGKPRDCGPPACVAGEETSHACVAGACTTVKKKCEPYGCGGNTCAKTCSSFSDCGFGYYCVQSLCLSCGDFLSQPGFFPTFHALETVPGVNLPGTGTLTPALSADRRSLYFASDRPGGQGGADLYVATRAAADLTTPFGAPTLLSALSSKQDDLDPFPLGGVLYFASTRSGGQLDLFRSGPALAGPATPLAGGTVDLPLLTAAREAHPSLTDDGKRLFFDTTRSSPAVGDPLLELFTAARASDADPFAAVHPVAGIVPAQAPARSVSAGSPSTVRDGRALFFVGEGQPAHGEVGVAHVDPATGNATSPATLIANLDVGAGDRVQVSGDGCLLLLTSKKDNPLGDAAWSYRTGLTACGQNNSCGVDDGCCPAADACSGLVDADCPYPRTWLVSEYENGKGKHDYLLAGETPKAGYTPTGNGFRVFPDKLSSVVVPLYRLVSTACDGTRSVYVGTESSRMPGYTVELQLGYVFPSTAPVRGSEKLYRARNDAGCDARITFDQKFCQSLFTQGYKSCDTLPLFGVRP